MGKVLQKEKFKMSNIIKVSDKEAKPILINLDHVVIVSSRIQIKGISDHTVYVDFVNGVTIPMNYSSLEDAQDFIELINKKGESLL
jgi:hypothetical protein